LPSSSLSFDVFFFGLVDAAYVAHHVAAQLAVGIAAKQPGLDVDAGKAKALRRETRHFLVRQAVRIGSDSKFLTLRAGA
jgi:hypothetical protein